ncbi:hypothetical protein BC936DRAFT_146706 [Jimgerdemannia flammicorona]|uniref:Uncharacterized protein n=1 Tax=Jimgerdemannia flammicorona TaxID=994334 RepID=A0A433D6Y3_9FUNG|nr:hypothetical protein BC936DRAFT_146706 [Jimgerdemannia flammicorona]
MFSTSSTSSTATLLLPPKRLHATRLEPPLTLTPSSSNDKRDAKLAERMEMVLDGQPAAVEELREKLERLDTYLRDLEAQRPKPRSAGHRLNDSLHSNTDELDKKILMRQELERARAAHTRELRSHSARLRAKERKLEELMSEEERLKKNIAKHSTSNHHPAAPTTVPTKSAMKPTRPASTDTDKDGATVAQERAPADPKTVRWDEVVAVREFERWNDNFDQADIISATLSVILMVLIIGLLLVGLPVSERQRLVDTVQSVAVGVRRAVAYVQW